MSSEGLVVVTGGAGYVASHCIQQLLERGYSVRATVRGDASRHTHLAQLASEHPGRLTFASIDLLDDADAWAGALAGADYVMHTASPYLMGTVSDPQRQLVDPAIDGTLHVLEGALRVPSVRRVVLTSSVAAVTDAPVNGHVYTEADWNETSSLSRNPYYFSKTLAERAAWRFVDERTPHFSLVACNPFVVIGPNLAASGRNPSTDILVDILGGRFPAVVSLAWSFVDVRDVAAAHLLLMERPEASGRYIAANPSLRMDEVVKLLRENGYAEGFSLPRFDMACGVGSALVKVSALREAKDVRTYLWTNLDSFFEGDFSKLKGLGWTPRDVRQSILDTVADLIARGVLVRKKSKKSE
jgi:dihydroflavonol-4-reductase